MDEMGATLLYVIGMSSIVLLPLTFVVGILTTFRIAGPLYRMELHLKKIINGEATGPCTIRKGDKLQDFVNLLNEAVGVLGARARENDHDGAQGAPEEKAA